MHRQQVRPPRMAVVPRIDQMRALSHLEQLTEVAVRKIFSLTPSTVYVGRV